MLDSTPEQEQFSVREPAHDFASTEIRPNGLASLDYSMEPIQFAVPMPMHARRFAADTAMKVAINAVQAHGGYGFGKKYPAEKLMPDPKIIQLYEGASQMQRPVITPTTLLPRRTDEAAVAA